MSLYRNHVDLPVYQTAIDAAMHLFVQSKDFPKAEIYSLTDQLRRSSRSVCANIAEAWRRRRFSRQFVSTLNIADGEAAETQVWIQFAVECEYLNSESARPIYQQYDEILAQLVTLIRNPEPWTLSS